MQVRPQDQHDPDDIAPVEPTTPRRATNTRPPNSAESPSTDRTHLSSRGASSSPIGIGPFQWSDDSSPKQLVKPKRGILGFLSIKEPSTSAWIEFAQQHKADAGLRGNRPAGFQTQKLPRSVPPVNSKWDGLPGTARSRSGTLSSWKRNIDTANSATKRSGDSFNRSSSSHSSSTKREQHPFPLPASSHRNNPSSDSAAPIHTNNVPSQQQPSLNRTASESDLRLGPTISNQSFAATIATADDDFDPTDFSPLPDLSLFSLPSYNSTTTASLFEPRQTPALRRDFDFAAPDDPPVIAPPNVQRAIVAEPKSDNPALPTTPTNKSSPSFLRSFRSKSASSSQELHSIHAPRISTSSTTSDIQNETADAPDVPRVRNAPFLQDTVGEASATSSPYTPSTPEEPVLVSQLTKAVARGEHPAVIHTRSRSTEDSPQWPLSQSAVPAPELQINQQDDDEDVDDAVPPPVPLKSARRLSASSFDSDTIEQPFSADGEPSVQQSQLEGALPPSPSPSSSPSAPIVQNRVRSFSRPLPRSPNPSSPSRPQRALPMGTISIVRDSTTYTTSTLRAPPAFQPGRVITKDSDLATIPESDTTSLRTVSAIDPDEADSDGINNNNTNPALKTSMYLDTDTDSESDNLSEDPTADDNYLDDEDDYQVPVSNSQDHPLYPDPPEDQRAASEQSWLDLSPRERLGLGSSIRKESDEDLPWAMDQPGGMQASSSSAAGAPYIDGNTGKRSSIIRVFKRT